MAPKLSNVDLMLATVILIACFASQLQVNSGESITGADSFQQGAQEPLHTNYQSNGQKFRVNVSNICEKNQMRVTVRINRPFYGLIHAKDKRRKPNCFLEGTGDQTYTLDIYFTQIQTESNYCGVVSHQLKSPTSQQLIASNNQSKFSTNDIQQQTLSVILVVRLHRSIEFSDDRFFLLSCANRCQRSDCSTLTTSSSNLSIHNAQLINPNLLGEIATSDSFVTPSLGQSIPFERAKHSGESCDSLLELKFHWLTRICWLLAIIFAIVCFISFCLCMSLKNNKQSELRLKKAKANHPSIRTRSAQKQQQQQTAYTGKSVNGAENCSWSAATTTTNEDYSADSTSYLMKHQLVNAQEPVIGRMAGTFATTIARNPQRQYQAQYQVKRRRSVGASSQRAPNEFRSNESNNNRTQHESKLTASQRAKSQSQTIIHYNQQQDPYKAIPFQFVNDTDYLAHNSVDIQAYNDFAAEQSVNTLQSAYEPPQHVDAQYDEGNTTSYQPIFTDRSTEVHENLSNPDEPLNIWSTMPPNTANISNQQTGFKWPTTVRNNSTFVPTSTNDTPSIRQITKQQMLSQFDPNNSRQLIDLIQHKHRQQIIQANKTAASLQLPKDNFLGQQH